MRLLGSLPRDFDARTFSEYLYASGIKNKIEVSPDPVDKRETWNVWVYSEDQLDQAQALLKEFQSHPDSPGIQTAVAVARQKRDQEEEELNAYRKRIFTPNRIFPAMEVSV